MIMISIVIQESSGHMTVDAAGHCVKATDVEKMASNTIMEFMKGLAADCAGRKMIISERDAEGHNE